VLIISLNRWEVASADDAMLYCIEVIETIRFQDIMYSLCGVFCHLGLSPHGGYYVAVTRHFLFVASFRSVLVFQRLYMLPF